MRNTTMALESKRAKPSYKVMVTGGSGLVGRALQELTSDPEERRRRAGGEEEWVFLSSRDGDLR